MLLHGRIFLLDEIAPIFMICSHRGSMFSKLCKAIVFHKNLCTEVVRIWHPVEKKNRDYCLFLCWMTLEILYLKKVKIGFVDEEMF